MEAQKALPGRQTTSCDILLQEDKILSFQEVEYTGLSSSMQTYLKLYS